MKLFLLLSALLTSALFAGESPDATWPPKKISFIVAYCYDYIQDDRGADPVFPDGSLHKGIIRSATVQLSAEQQQRLIKAVSTETEFEESEDCYYPHHAFVFYDEARKPLGWIGVCLGCGNYAFSSKSAPEYISYRELSKLCAELKLPTFYDSDGQGLAYTELYRAEQPERERASVVSWPQYLKRVTSSPEGGGTQGDEYDPFAEPEKKSTNRQNKAEMATPRKPSD
jgi:hypothetical protein